VHLLGHKLSSTGKAKKTPKEAMKQCSYRERWKKNKMVPSALKCYRKASRKEEKVVLFISTGVDRKLHGKMKKKHIPQMQRQGRRGCARKEITYHPIEQKKGKLSK
jgi:hypothetical protein